MNPKIKQAFDAMANQLSTLRLTKQEHIMVEQVIQKGQQFIEQELTPKAEKKAEGTTEPKVV